MPWLKSKKKDQELAAIREKLSQVEDAIHFDRAIVDRAPKLERAVAELNWLRAELVQQERTVEQWKARARKLEQQRSNFETAIRQLEAQLSQVRSEKDHLHDLWKRVDTDLSAQNREVVRLNEELDQLNDQPPFININDARQQLFELGSATIDRKFKRHLETLIATEIAGLASSYDAEVIEVIGHTDETPIGPNREAHIDRKLLAILNNRANLRELVPRSNMDLGMARAVAVALVLGNHPKLQSLTIRPMSAGQTTLPNEQIAPYLARNPRPDAERRRIEIRVRRKSVARTIE